MSGQRHQSTLEALLETTRLLWPAPACSRVDGTLPKGHRVVRDYVLLPGRRQPRLALPVHDPRVAAKVFQKYSQGLSVAERAVRTTFSRLVALPAVNRTLTTLAPHRLSVSAPAGHRVESLETHLAQLLDSEVVISVGVGRPRANRKPVLHVLDPEGRSLAFVKVGTSPLTRELVRGEADALRSYWSAGPREDLVAVPRILHHGSWRSLELLVLSPVLPTSPRWRRRPDVPTAAMRELGVRLGTTRRALGSSPMWADVRSTPRELADRDQAAAFERIVDAAEARFGSTPVTLGAWHGDWTPWNMAWDQDQVLLWDFERFATGVPLGFDLAHYRLQSLLRAEGERAAEQLVRADLSPNASTGGHGAAEGDDPAAVRCAYLVELTRRYVRASEPVEGTPLRARTAWLLGLLDELVVRR